MMNDMGNYKGAGEELDVSTNEKEY